MIIGKFTCSVCKKEMSSLLKGVEISIKPDNIKGVLDQRTVSELDKIKLEFGTTEFNICMFCWLKSMGVEVIEDAD